jgi:hypothetical protein
MMLRSSGRISNKSRDPFCFSVGTGSLLRAQTVVRCEWASFVRGVLTDALSGQGAPRRQRFLKETTRINDPCSRSLWQVGEAGGL